MHTDSEIFQAIVTEITNSPVLRYAKLNLHIQDGIVTISGRVNSFAERKAVERAARRVSGIGTLILEIGAAAVPLTVADFSLATPKVTA